MGQAQINVRTRACSGTFIARTKQAALTHNVRGKRLRKMRGRQERRKTGRDRGGWKRLLDEEGKKLRAATHP